MEKTHRHQKVQQKKHLKSTIEETSPQHSFFGFHFVFFGAEVKFFRLFKKTTLYGPQAKKNPPFCCKAKQSIDWNNNFFASRKKVDPTLTGDRKNPTQPQPMVRVFFNHVVSNQSLLGFAHPSIHQSSQDALSLARLEGLFTLLDSHPADGLVTWSELTTFAAAARHGLAEKDVVTAVEAESGLGWWVGLVGLTYFFEKRNGSQDFFYSLLLCFIYVVFFLNVGRIYIHTYSDS